MDQEKRKRTRAPVHFDVTVSLQGIEKELRKQALH